MKLACELQHQCPNISLEYSSHCGCGEYFYHLRDRSGSVSCCFQNPLGVEATAVPYDLHVFYKLESARSRSRAIEVFAYRWNITHWATVTCAAVRGRICKRSRATYDALLRLIQSGELSQHGIIIVCHLYRRRWGARESAQDRDMTAGKRKRCDQDDAIPEVCSSSRVPGWPIQAPVNQTVDRGSEYRRKSWTAVKTQQLPQ